MKLIIVRHGDAEARAESDFARRLTDKGHRQAKELGKYLRDAGLQPDRIIHSPLVRARETAEHLQESLSAKIFSEDNTLACGMSPAEAKALLRNECGLEKCVMLVGHAPDLGSLLADLLGAGDEMPMKKCGCAVLDVSECKTGGATLRVYVSPAYLP